MESLVKTFGYTQDTDLLKWVIEKNRFDKMIPRITESFSGDRSVREASSLMQILLKYFRSCIFLMTPLKTDSSWMIFKTI